jgi:hypothetical protein
LRRKPSASGRQLTLWQGRMPRPKVPKEYRDPFLHCRTFGHTWRLGPSEAQSNLFHQFILNCQECGTRRIDVINRRTGALGGHRRYEYPEGYQSKRGEAVARTVYRIEFIKRVTHDS